MVKVKNLARTGKGVTAEGNMEMAYDGEKNWRQMGGARRVREGRWILNGGQGPSVCVGPALTL